MPSTSRSRGSSGGPHGSPRTSLMGPMSERQQMALVMQLTSNANQQAREAAPNPAEERKRCRQQRNERGETPLHVAAIKGDKEQVKKLLEQGQDPDVADFAGWTALHEACSYGWLTVVEVLVDGGANVNAKGLDDDTPLHDAATSGNLAMVKYLVEKGGDPFAKNTKGKYPSDYAAPPINEYLQTLERKENARGFNANRARDDSSKKSGNASSSSEGGGKRANMDRLASDHEKEGATQEKTPTESKDEASSSQLGIASSTSNDEHSSSRTRYYEDTENADDEEVTKRKKKKDNEDKDASSMPKPASSRANQRVLTGSKPPGPASKTGATPLGKSGSGQSTNKGSGGTSSGKNSGQSGQKGSSGSGKANLQNLHQGKSSGSKNSGSQSKSDRKSPVASPKSNQNKDDDDDKSLESLAPKVPPLKIVIPGGAGAGNRNEQEGEGGIGQRGGGKGRGNSSTLPYIIPCTNNDAGQASDSSDGNSDDKRSGEGKGVQRVLRSHRTNDEKDKDRTSPQTGSGSQALNSNKSPPPSSSGQDDQTVSSSTNIKSEAGSGNSVELHPRKRKIKASKDNHHREQSTKSAVDTIAENTGSIANSNPYQMYIYIRKQINNRQKSLFPVKPKPPKDFNKYLMNRCTYTLQSNVTHEPQIEIPPNLPTSMKDEFLSQEKERHRLRVQHLVEKEKLVLAVEQEILRVHGRAERAVANQALPYSVCTILRDEDVYNVVAPEQEEKRNAQRSRCNGRQINSWLQEVDDKWEKIKEGMLLRQHTEAETLHAVQKMSWEWKLKEVGLCDYKSTPTIERTHVPQLHVTNFDLPA